MPEFIDLTDKRFGMLVVQIYRKNTPNSKWLCVCDCGKTRLVQSSRLRSGHTRHCGCQHTRNVAGLGPRRAATEYNSWVSMRNRCNNEKNQDYHYYGGRGIKVHPRWDVFKNFFDDMGKAPKNHTLDRIETDGNYEPGNCRWATSTTQNNNSRNCRRIEFRGEFLTITEWAARLGINISTLSERLQKWTVERALTTLKINRV